MSRGRRGGKRSGDLPERVCAVPGCAERAVARSVFCRYHESTAVGEAGTRELRQLMREMERLGRIADPAKKVHAVAKFRKRVEQGDFAILFSGKMQDSLERVEAESELRLELGAVRLAMVRAMQEIEDPGEMARRITELANAAVRLRRADS